MKSVMRTGVLIVVAVGLLAVYLSTFVVDEREQALVLRFGEIQRSIDKPGLYVKLPFAIVGADEVIYTEDRVLFFESNDKRVQVRDGRRYLVDTITMIRIANPRKFRESVGANLRIVRDRLETRLDAALRATYGRRTFEAALSKERGAMMREIRDELIPEASDLGIKVVDVRIRRTDLLPEVLQSTYDRMSAERLAEAEEIRALGNERSLTIRAQADRQAVVLVAEAQRESEIIRGQGDATRNNLFADAFTRDPEFFAFYRSMQAYAKSLQGSDTTLVLRPDSEFFRYFSSDGAKNAPSPDALDQPPQGSPDQPSGGGSAQPAQGAGQPDQPAQAAQGEPAQGAAPPQAQ